MNIEEEKKKLLSKRIRLSKKYQLLIKKVKNISQELVLNPTQDSFDILNYIAKINKMIMPNEINNADNIECYSKANSALKFCLDQLENLILNYTPTLNADNLTKNN